jgi:monoamine oxidase
MRSRSQVLVVGAGLSGLATAYRLERAGVDVGVFEARDRVGGRAWRIPVGDSFFDAGCEALDREHSALRSLANEVGVSTWEAPPWSSDPPADLEGAEADLFGEFEGEIEALAARVDPDHPEEVEHAAELDAQNLAGWLEERGATARVLEAAENWIAVASSTLPTREMSWLAYAVKLAAGAAPTGLTLRLDGGPTALAESLLTALDGRVQLSRPVVGLDDDGNGVDVRLADGTVLRADRVVVAVPLTVQSGLRFDPPLPELRQRALAEARYGVVVKEAALYDRGFSVPDPEVSAEGHFYASAHDPRLLVRFAGAGAAERRIDLGAMAGARPVAQVAVDWAGEAWNRGSYLILGPGQLLSWGQRLGDPHGRVHFAGAERATLKSYMEGAVRAADEVVAEVLDSLGIEPV